MIQQISDLLVVEEKLRGRPALLHRRPQIFDFAPGNLAIFALHSLLHGLEEAIGADAARHLLQPIRVHTVRYNDGHRAQFHPTAVLRGVILPYGGQAVLQLAELNVPVHGGNTALAVDLRAEALGTGAQLLRQVVGLMEGIFLMDQRHTGAGGVGHSRLLAVLHGG